MMNQPYEPNQKKGPGATKIILIVLIFIGVPCVLLGIVVATLAKRGMEMASKTVMPMVSCAFNFTSARNGMLAYAKDHDGTLPKAESWQDDIKTYYTKSLSKELKSKGGEVMGVEFKLDPWPEDGKWGCRVNDTDMTGIAFNSKLSGKKLTDVADQSSTVVVFEVPKVGRNLHQEYVPLAKEDAPRMFGESRDWLVAHFSGEVDFKAGKRKTFTFGSQEDKAKDMPSDRTESK